MEQARTTFGQYLAKKRKEKGWNLRHMASLIKKEDGQPISYQYISELENGRRNPPSDYIIERIAEVLKVPAGILFIKARRVPAYLDIEDEGTADAAWQAFQHGLRQPAQAA